MSDEYETPRVDSITFGGFTVAANADAESQLLAVVAQVFTMDLDGLDDAARARVARYVADRWGTEPYPGLAAFPSRRGDPGDTP